VLSIDVALAMRVELWRTSTLTTGREGGAKIEEIVPMAQPKRGPVVLVAWKSPEDQPLSLSPTAEDGASLDVEIEDGAVTIRGRKCRFVWCDVKKKQRQGEKVLAEVEVTIPLAQCQINWRFVETELPE
jgi:SH3-like domain-containing protein